MATFTASRLALQGATSVTKITSSSQEIFGESLFRPARLSLSHKTRATRHGVHYIAPKSAHPQGPTNSKRGGSVVARGSMSMKGLFTHDGKEKVKPTLTFYVHEIRGGEEATVKLAAGTGNGDFQKLGFGSFCVFDNFVREGEATDSKLIGRERGNGTVTDLTCQEGLQLTSNISFNADSKYDGSSLIFSGNVGGRRTNAYEVIILGGTGHFRGARGHAVVQGLLPVVGINAAFHWNVFITQ